MSKQKESYVVETVYGDYEIETYECDSCGNVVAYEHTVPFTIGDTEGRACEHCEENGPISFPKRVVEDMNLFTNADMHLLGFVSLAPILIPACTIIGFVEDEPCLEGIAATTVAMVFWAVVVFVTFVLL